MALSQNTCFEMRIQTFHLFFSILDSWSLLGFLASWLFGFSASGLFGFLLVYDAAFGGFLALAFRILCIPSSSSAGGVLAFAAFAWFVRLLGALAFRILPASSASPVPHYLESSLLQTSWGAEAPPNPPATA